jgi:hypothetical protein
VDGRDKRGHDDAGGNRSWRSPFVGRATLLRLLLDRTGKAAAKALRFAPRFANAIAETSEPGRCVDDDECEHG